MILDALFITLKDLVFGILAISFLVLVISIASMIYKERSWKKGEGETIVRLEKDSEWQWPAKNLKGPHGR